MAEYTWRQWENEQNEANLLHAADCERWQAGIELAGGTWDGSWTDLDTSGKGLITIDQFNALESQIQSKVSSYTPKGYDPDSTVQIVPGPDGWNKVEDGILKAVCTPDGVNRNYLTNSTGNLGTTGWSRGTVVDGYDKQKGMQLIMQDVTSTSRTMMQKYIYGLSGTPAGTPIAFSFWYYIDSSYPFEVIGSSGTQIMLRQQNPETSTYNNLVAVQIRSTDEPTFDQWIYAELLTALPLDQEDQTLTFSVAIAGNGSYAVSEVKVELADKTTAWSPAPEDFGYPENTTLSATPQSVEESDEVAAPEAEEIE